MSDLPQVLGIAGLQLTLLMRKRFILALVTLWLVRLVILLQLGPTGAVPMLIPSLHIADLLVVVMACGFIADDAEAGTFAFVLSHGIDRRTFLVGKLIPVVCLALAFSMLAHVATLWMTRSPEATTVAGYAGRLAAASGLSLARILVVAALTVFLAVTLTNRYLVAMATLLFIYGLPSVLHSLLSPQSSGVWILESLLPWRDSFDRAAVALFTAGIAAGTLASCVVQPLLYALFFGALTVRALERRDLFAS